MSSRTVAQPLESAWAARYPGAQSDPETRVGTLPTAIGGRDRAGLASASPRE